MLACLLGPSADPPPSATHALVTEIKDHVRLQDSRVRPTLPYILHYPDNPRDFPQAIRLSAYAFEPPASVALERLPEMSRRIVLRSSHRGVATSPATPQTNAVQGLLNILQQNTQAQHNLPFDAHRGGSSPAPKLALTDAPLGRLARVQALICIRHSRVQAFCHQR